MSSHRRGDLIIPMLSLVTDALAIEAAFLLAYWLRFKSGLLDSLGFVLEGAPALSLYMVGSMAVTVVWLLLFEARKMYRARRSVNLSDELINVVRVISLGMLLILSA